MSEWIEKKVKELCIIGRGRVISQDEINPNPGIYPVFSSQTANNGEMGKIETFDFEGEYVTWTTDGANAGTVFYRSGKFNCTNVCGTLKEKENDSLDLQFFSYLLSTEAKKHVSYIGNPKLMNGVMAEVKLNLPKDKPEQTHIAEILSTADEAIAHTEALIAKYQRIKTGLMQDLLTRGIDENGNIRSKETHKFIHSGFRNVFIPEKWISATFKNITKCKQGLQIPIEKRFKEEGLGRLPYITVQAINSRFKNPEFIQNANIGVICNVEDILFTRTGNTGEIITGIEGVFHNNFFRLDYNRELIEKEYLITFLKWQPIQILIKDLAGTTTIPDLNHKDFFTIPIFFPKDKKEQVRIIEKITGIQNDINIIEKNLKKLQSLKTGLMQDLLSGKVRVNMDSKN